MVEQLVEYGADCTASGLSPKCPVPRPGAQTGSGDLGTNTVRPPFAGSGCGQYHVILHICSWCLDGATIL